MARTYTPKGKHTSPENAGAKNITNPELLPKDEFGITSKIMGVRKHSNIYKGQWTPEALELEISSFFDYCVEQDLKPTVPLLRMWLNISRTQFYEWQTKPEKHGEKTNLIQRAMDFMEAYLQYNMDKYPTGSIFLLKTTHGHVDTQKVDITTTQSNTPEEVQDMVSKLGLDKTE